MICHNVFEILEDSSSSVKYINYQWDYNAQLCKTLGDCWGLL